jgi:hypothetical protein
LPRTLRALLIRAYYAALPQHYCTLRALFSRGIITALLPHYYCVLSRIIDVALIRSIITAHYITLCYRGHYCRYYYRALPHYRALSRAHYAQYVFSAASITAHWLLRVIITHIIARHINVRSTSRIDIAHTATLPYYCRASLVAASILQHIITAHRINITLIFHVIIT